MKWSGEPVCPTAVIDCSLPEFFTDDTDRLLDSTLYASDIYFTQTDEIEGVLMANHDQHRIACCENIFCASSNFPGQEGIL